MKVLDATATRVGLITERGPEYTVDGKIEDTCRVLSCENVWIWKLQFVSAVPELYYHSVLPSGPSSLAFVKYKFVDRPVVVTKVQM